MSDIDNLIQKIHTLNIQQRKTVSEVIEAITSCESTTVEPKVIPTISTKPKRVVNDLFISSNGAALAVGDKVIILNNRKTGKKGDTAVITKFNKKFVALILTRNQSYTQRDAKNLELIQERK